MKKGLLYAILAAILWAIVNPFIKQGLSYDFSPMNFAGLRFVLSGVVLMLYTWHKGMWREMWEHRKLFLNLIIINMFIGYATFYWGVDMVSSAISSIVMGLTPLVNVFLAHILISNDKLNRYKILSLIISLIGLLLIIGTGGKDGQTLDWIGVVGIIMLLVSIIVQGYSAISVAEEKGKIDPIFLNAVQMIFGGAMLYIAGIFTEGFQPFWDKPIGFHVSLGVLILISIFGFNFWFTALQAGDTKVSDMNMTRLINPILGAILSWMLIPDEVPTIATVLGMIIIVSSLIVYFKGESIVIWIKRKRHQQQIGK